jgi:hypothetical protein
MPEKVLYSEFNPFSYLKDGDKKFTGISDLDINVLVEKLESAGIPFDGFLQIGKVKNSMEKHYISGFNRNVFAVKDFIDWIELSNDCMVQDPAAQDLKDIILKKLKDVVND